MIRRKGAEERNDKQAWLTQMLYQRSPHIAGAARIKRQNGEGAPNREARETSVVHACAGPVRMPVNSHGIPDYWPATFPVNEKPIKKLQSFRPDGL